MVQLEVALEWRSGGVGSASSNWDWWNGGQSSRWRSDSELWIISNSEAQWVQPELPFCVQLEDVVQHR